MRTQRAPNLGFNGWVSELSSAAGVVQQHFIKRVGRQSDRGIPGPGNFREKYEVTTWAYDDRPGVRLKSHGSERRECPLKRVIWLRERELVEAWGWNEACGLLGGEMESRPRSPHPPTLPTPRKVRGKSNSFIRTYVERLPCSRSPNTNIY